MSRRDALCARDSQRIGEHDFVVDLRADHTCILDASQLSVLASTEVLTIAVDCAMCAWLLSITAYLLSPALVTGPRDTFPPFQEVCWASIISVIASSVA